MDIPYKIKVKIGEAAFEAEGKEETVKEQYNAFLQALSLLPNAKAATPPIVSGADPSQVIPEGEIPQSVLDRVFKNGDTLSLLARPSGDNAEANGLLILIYGLTVLQNAKSVTGVTLMKAAKQSALKVLRVDRVIESRKDLVLTAGQRRGRSYSLNNRGIEEAKRIILDLVK